MVIPPHLRPGTLLLSPNEKIMAMIVAAGPSTEFDDEIFVTVIKFSTSDKDVKLRHEDGMPLTVFRGWVVIA